MCILNGILSMWLIIRMKNKKCCFPIDTISYLEVEKCKDNKKLENRLQAIKSSMDPSIEL